MEAVPTRSAGDPTTSPLSARPGRGRSADNRSTTWPSGTKASPTTDPGLPTPRARRRSAPGVAGRGPEARELLTSLRRAEERGEPSAYALIRLHLCELELRVGAWGEANDCSTTGEPPPTTRSCTGRCTSAAGRSWPRDAVTPRRRDAGAARPRQSGVDRRAMGLARSQASTGPGGTARKGPHGGGPAVATVWDHTQGRVSRTPASSRWPPTWSRRWSRATTSSVHGRDALAEAADSGPPVGAARCRTAEPRRCPWPAAVRRARRRRWRRRPRPTATWGSPSRRPDLARPRPGAATRQEVGRRAGHSRTRCLGLRLDRGRPDGRRTRARSWRGSVRGGRRRRACSPPPSFASPASPWTGCRTRRSRGTSSSPSTPSSSTCATPTPSSASDPACSWPPGWQEGLDPRS